MRKWLRRLLLALVVLTLLVTLGLYLAVRGSLPRLDGETALRGLGAPVSVLRDAGGVVTIDATNQRDALRALGYVHAQERYFEMDLMRRAPAGELSELFGPLRWTWTNATACTACAPVCTPAWTWPPAASVRHCRPIPRA